MSDPQSAGRPGRTEAPDATPAEPAATAEEVAPEELDAPAGPPTEPVRIAAPPASVAAGLASPPTISPEIDALLPPPPPPPPLPDWTDPPTGQVPRILLEHDADEHAEPALKGPMWRQEAADWAHDDDLGLAFLLDEDEDDEPELIAGRTSGPDESDEDERAFFGPPRRRRRSRRRARPPVHEKAEGSPPAPAAGEARPARRGRNPLVATATGLAFGAVAVACFLLGAPTTLALVALVLTLAAGEVLATLRRAGRKPFAPLALAAVPAFALAAYGAGAASVSWVLIALILLGVLWLLATGGRVSPVRDLSATVFVAVWLGIPGAFAGLLLSPALFPHRHGVAACFAVVATVVAHDVGSYVVGSRLGRHKLAPRVSPGKTWEGWAGGTVLAAAVAVGGLSHLHPLGLGAGAVLAVIVAVLAPLGDLAESLVKRDLAVKDMGRLLPEHGGVFDRVDAMLFVLPAAYAYFRLAHLG